MKKVLSLILTVFLMVSLAACNVENGDNTVQHMTEAPTEDTTEISNEAEIILMRIAEDCAAQIARNPSTVKFSTFSWGFARDGRVYAVQGTFECSNLMGVKEEHVIEVWCEASEDYSKIQPYKVNLDDKTIIDKSKN